MNPARLLVVDDVANNRDLLSRRFKRLGFDVVEADSGTAALALISRTDFDLVFLDMLMPGLNGLEVLKIIRSTRTPSSLPVIMVTAKADGQDVAEALALGANDHISKPYEFPVVLARTHNQLDRKMAEESLALHARKLGAVNEELQKEIVERKQSEERIRRMTYHDALTGLPNRVKFREQLSDLLEEPTNRIALYYLDLDGFKIVNDTYGHPTGDALLKAVGERMAACVGAGGHVVRLGGDEFAIIQLAVDRPDVAKDLAATLIEAITQPFEIDDHAVFVGLSIGIALESHLGDDAEGRHVDAFVKKADLALYVAKAEGRNTCRFFSEEMSQRTERRRMIALQLRDVAARDELQLQYQPILDAERDVPSCFEALMRWSSPTCGAVSPAEFIPVAEGTGAIDEIGAWALQRACADAATWPHDIRVAVNLSPLQFRAGNLPALVRHALRESGLPPGRLELEITESVLLNEIASTLTTLEELRRMGISISLDDFGTGYSSLSYLLKFPFDKIKIDQSFVRDFPHNSSSLAVVRSIKALADGLDMHTVAEGVETEEQFRHLLSEGCTQLQGHYISPPIPAAEISSFLLSRFRLRLRPASVASGSRAASG